MQQKTGIITNFSKIIRLMIHFAFFSQISPVYNGGLIIFVIEAKFNLCKNLWALGRHMNILYTLNLGHVYIMITLLPCYFITDKTLNIKYGCKCTHISMFFQIYLKPCSNVLILDI